MNGASIALLAVISYLLLFTHVTMGHSVDQIRGYVLDAQTQEPLPGVTILVENTTTGTVSDGEGYYELSLSPGTYQLLFSSISYEQQRVLVQVPSDTLVSVALATSFILTEEVVVRSTPLAERKNQTVDKLAIDTKTLNDIPYLMGEVDPVKAVQLLPGVQAAGDGNTGFYVRGGGADQNLVQFDGATVYNASHLFGFFSVFNGNAVDRVTLTKSGIPAQYGGRLSSVLEVASKSGDFEAWHGKGSLGLIAANLSVEGPLVKDRLSLSLAGRRTYYDLIRRPLTQYASFLKSGLDYYFYDGNVKLDYRISDRNRLTLSGYTGRDEFYYNNANAFTNDIAWGNRTLSLNWRHVHTAQLFSETLLTYSRYQMDFGATVSDYRLQMASAVRDFSGQYTLTYNPTDRYEITAGVAWVRHRFAPNDVQIETEGADLDFGETEVLHAEEGALFLNDQRKLSSRLTLNNGLRLTHFRQLGPFNRYPSGQPGAGEDTLTYDRGTSVARYTKLEPRSALVYQLNKASTLKLSYDRAYQFVHMVPIAASSLPTDVWLPSSDKIKPQASDQYALGYFRDVRGGDYEGSLTVYYKNMYHQIEYQDGVLIGYDNSANFDDNFLFGRGRSYGSELFLKKRKGHLTGWLSYTWSNTRRRFDEIDEGRSYPARYDRRHNLSVLVNYRRHPRWSFSGVFALASGNTVTLPVGRYVINGNVVNEYDGRNNFRMPMYHRLDVSATYERQRGERFATSWIFSLYNVYSRLNPYYLYFDVDGDIKEYRLEVKAKQISLFPIIPSVTYRFSF